MSDEFAKGLVALCGGMFGWMIFSGWYTTEGFESTQLIAPRPENVDIYGTLALILREALFWFAIFGALTFWVIIPALKQARAAWEERQSSN
ncbi:MAG TPA: hypothetical protein VFJ06_04700 [Halococcus sp.]|nr:hypothetical protein [Halococcus sp.]